MARRVATLAFMLCLSPVLSGITGGGALWGGVAHAETVDNSSRLTILADQDSFPQSFMLNGEPAGILFELLRDFAREQNIELAYRALPLKRALENAASTHHGYVGINGFSSIGTFIQSDPISHTRLFAVTLKKRGLDIRRADDLTKLQLGINRGLPVQGALASAMSQNPNQAAPYNSVRQAMSLLQIGRIDAALIYCGYLYENALTGVAGLSDETMAGLEIHKNPVMDAINRLALPASPENARLIKRFNSYLANARSNGKLERIYDRFVPKGQVTEMVLAATAAAINTGTGFGPVPGNGITFPPPNVTR